MLITRDSQESEVISFNHIPIIEPQVAYQLMVGFPFALFFMQFHTFSIGFRFVLFQG